MKKLLPYFIGIALFTSCKSQFPITHNSNAAKDTAYKCFIKPIGKKIIAGDNIEIKNEAKLFKATTYGIGGQNFKLKEIESYQDNDGYYLRIPKYGLTKAITGPRINVFQCYSSTTSFDASTGRTSTRSSLTHVMKKIGQPDFAIESLKSTKTIAEWVEDNNDAYEQAQIAQHYVKKVKMHRLISWGAIIGGMALMTNDPAVKSQSKNSKMSIGYVGVVLFPAGIVNLCINLGRRGKVGRALAKSINLYNEAPAPKKK